MRYVPYNRLGDEPNIIVDGKAQRSTVLTLSHWKGNATPVELKADLSAEIVFNYLAHIEHHVEAQAASNNHFDEDGLVGLFALINPEQAIEEKNILIDVATAGDFGTYRDRDAARICFVLQAWTQPDKSPLNAGVFSKPYHDLTSILYEELLPRFSKIIERIHYLEKYWSEEDTHLDWSENAIKEGHVIVESSPEIDLAVVRVSDDKEFNDTRPQLDSPRWTHRACHQFAVHNATDCSRILVLQGNHADFYYRYETWVETVARKPLPRVDLRRLADSLTGKEKLGVKWSAEDVSEIVPHLSIKGFAKSSIPQDGLIREFVSFFQSSAHKQ